MKHLAIAALGIRRRSDFRADKCLCGYYLQ